MSITLKRYCKIGKTEYCRVGAEMKQRTIRREASVSGKALHTGVDVKLTIKPAKENNGVLFRRVDLYNRPEIYPVVGSIGDLVRGTTITSGHVNVHTVEHILSSIY
jgi:UDP-3-O-[3-hydroxymyristoyl] N-acetylglucosamine deacetylase/3-hydroxyacyl-[acyl-carrier-protein] dehydratase